MSAQTRALVKQMKKRDIRILLFSSLFPHAGEPTLGIFVENRLRNLLADENVTATVIAPVPWFPFKSAIFGKYGRASKAAMVEDKNGINVYHPRYLVIPKIGMNFTPLFMYWSARRCIRKLVKAGVEFDVIDAHYLYPDSVAAMKLSAYFKKPFVVTARGSDVTEIALMKRPKSMILRAVKAASQTITVANNLRRDLIKLGADPDKITMLRNGVDLNRFRQTGREALRREWGNQPTMLFAGWLIPRKRLDLVLEVTARVPNLHTVIVGDGPLRSSLERKCRELGIYNRVHFLGQRKPEQMPQLYSAADILILASDREGWANVLLEAMACGTPVVARAIGGASDLVTSPEAGRLVQSDDPEQLANAVFDLLEKLPERSATRQFAEAFDWRATSLGQRRIFEEAISANDGT
jgi:glycosyltransferase involved in cell wall biosynthesis